MIEIDGMLLDKIDDLPDEVWDDDFGFYDWD